MLRAYGLPSDYFFVEDGTSSGETVQSDPNVSGSSMVVASYSDPRERK